MAGRSNSESISICHGFHHLYRDVSVKRALSEKELLLILTDSFLCLSSRLYLV